MFRRLRFESIAGLMAFLSAAGGLTGDVAFAADFSHARNWRFVRTSNSIALVYSPGTALILR